MQIIYFFTLAERETAHLGHKLLFFGRSLLGRMISLRAGLHCLIESFRAAPERRRPLSLFSFSRCRASRDIRASRANALVNFASLAIHATHPFAETRHRSGRKGWSEYCSALAEGLSARPDYKPATPVGS